MNKEKVLKIKPSAYRSMMMGKLGLTKSTPQKKKDLLRWGSATKGEKWINLTALITDNKKLPCGQKGKKQGNLPSVCRASIKISDKKTPKPLASQLSKQQIKKAIQIKQKGERINWKNL